MREGHHSQDRPQRPGSLLKAAEGRRCLVHRQNAASSFLLSSPRSCSARRCPGSGWGNPPKPATLPQCCMSGQRFKPDQAQLPTRRSPLSRPLHLPLEAVASLPRSGHPPSIPLTDGTATKSHQISNNEAWDNPEAWSRPAGRSKQLGERVFPHGISRRAGSSPRPGPGPSPRAGHQEGAGSRDRPALLPRLGDGQKRVRKPGHRRRGPGGAPNCRQQSPTETDTAGRSRGQPRPLPRRALTSCPAPE